MSSLLRCCATCRRIQTSRRDLFVPIAAPDPAKDGWGFGGSSVLRQLPDARRRRKRLEADMPGSYAATDPRGDDGDKGDAPVRAAVVAASPAILVADGGDDAGGDRIVTLLIALVNYVNLATARAGLRAREVAMRKVLGAYPARVGGAVPGRIDRRRRAGRAGRAGAGGTGAALDQRGGWHGTRDPLRRRAVDPVAAGAAGDRAGVMAGLYPRRCCCRVFPRPRCSPRHGRRGAAGRARLRQTLVVLQFAIAAALGAGTAILIAQTWHVRSADLGFDQRGLLLIRRWRPGARPRTAGCGFSRRSAPYRA